MSNSALPPISTPWLNWFSRYTAVYLRRNFHGLRLLPTGPLHTVEGWPLLVCLNHPSWWDPLVALYLSRSLFPNRRHYAPMAAEGLAKYKFFARLGFFGIEPHSYAGAAKFLEVGQEVMSENDRALWITPQGQFRDVRERPVQLASGVGHLAHRLSRFAMLPLALEYAFWNERYPEAFACFGQPLLHEDGRAHSADEWTRLFSSALENVQDTLSEHVKRRDPGVFESLLTGKAGVGGTYDLWRSIKSRLYGTKFQPRHGGLD